ncbi:MAG: hypothetical protein HRU40_21420 [Saprospiraceae bacterium]|nr:hypothetical protein [Saprospiraceae bacterium]
MGAADYSCISILWTKLSLCWLRLIQAFWWMPRRFKRAWRYSLCYFPVSIAKAGVYVVDLFCLTVEMLGVMEWYECVADMGKWKTRGLKPEERSAAQGIFGDSICWDRVRIDEQAFIGTRRSGICYVSGYTINLWGPISQELLIHELMHVWQFHHQGLAYIPRALRAYYSREGYNYGGVRQLREMAAKGKTLMDFNYEQQGDIIADYYRLRIGRPPQWGFAGIADMDVYEFFIAPLAKQEA